MTVRLRHGVPAALVAAALALTACGGGDDPVATGGGETSDHALGGPKNPIAASTPDAQALEKAREKGHFNESEPPREDGQPAVAETAGPGPCELVPTATVRTILGGPVAKPTEAPQGPTCIYRTRSGKGFLTVSLATIGADRTRAQIKGIPAVSVSGRKGYCRRPDRMALHVPLSDGRMLTVGAPCSTARAFAVKALARIDS